jgi:hypothetical protein
MIRSIISDGMSACCRETALKFFSINVVVGDEDNTYVRGGKMFPFPYLNEFNTKKGSSTE